MNGYKMTADSYRTYLQRDNPQGEARADMERKIKALDIMADTDRATQYELFNSSGFNDIAKGYFLKALYNIGVDEETRKAAMREIRLLFDEMTADQAEAFYMDH